MIKYWESPNEAITHLTRFPEPNTLTSIPSGSIVYPVRAIPCNDRQAYELHIESPKHTHRSYDIDGSYIIPEYVAAFDEITRKYNLSFIPFTKDLNLLIGFCVNLEDARHLKNKQEFNKALSVDDEITKVLVEKLSAEFETSKSQNLAGKWVCDHVIDPTTR